MNVIGEKKLEDFTLKDVRKAVIIASKMNSKTNRDVYISLEDKYTNNAKLYLEQDIDYVGGGRHIFGYIRNCGGSVFAKSVRNNDDEYYDCDKYCEILHDYIRETY